MRKRDSRECRLMADLWPAMTPEAQKYLPRASDVGQFCLLERGDAASVTEAVGLGLPVDMYLLMHYQLQFAVWEEITSCVQALGEVLSLLRAVPEGSSGLAYLVVHGAWPVMDPSVVTDWEARPDLQRNPLVGDLLRRYPPDLTGRWEDCPLLVDDLVLKYRGCTRHLPHRIKGVDLAAREVQKWAVDVPASAQVSAWLLCSRLLLQGLDPVKAGAVAVAMAD